MAATQNAEDRKWNICRALTLASEHMDVCSRIAVSQISKNGSQIRDMLETYKNNYSALKKWIDENIALTIIHNASISHYILPPLNFVTLSHFE